MNMPAETRKDHRDEDVAALHDELRQLTERLGPPSRWSLGDRYQVGLRLEKLRLALAEHASGYGDQIAKRLSERHGLPQRLVEQLLDFAGTFSRDELIELEGLTMPNGKPLTWTHLRVLLRLKDPDVRAELVRQAVAGGWSADRMAAAAQDVRGGKASRGGRRPAPPADLDGLLIQLGRAVDDLLNRDQVCADEKYSLTTLVAGLPAGPDGEPSRRRLRELRGRLDAAGPAVKRLLRAVDEAVRLVDGRTDG